MAICGALWRWLRALLRLCGLCGGRRAQRSSQEGSPKQAPADGERQRLLAIDARRSAAVGAQQQRLATQQQPTRLIVMRHGHRQDEEDAFWHQTAARPWDPPLSATGKTQAVDAAALLQAYSVDYVISSPFRRCLQTSAGVIKGLPQLAKGHWLVDWQLSEICEQRVLFGQRADIKERIGSNAISTWMWSGAQLDAALDKFVHDECRLSQLPLQPLARKTRPPAFPETLEMGLQRYSQALEEIARSFAGNTVLVVTHGECVRQAVMLAEPHSEVFEVRHTGYVALQQVAPVHGVEGVLPPRGPVANAARWELTTEPGETGVLWLEDDD